MQYICDGGKDESRYSEDRITNKVRFNEGSGDADMNMTIDLDQPPIVSWKEKQLGGTHPPLMDLIERFHAIEDYNRVSTRGPWIIHGQYLTVQPWTKDFSLSQSYPSIVMAWIRLPGLSRNRGRFARMVVFVNLDKLLISQ
ncbi:hypothetical protein Goarm_021327, partial [Gossypium armourianum]|nr:hypothetical protein [Gossypium armourianum]